MNKQEEIREGTTKQQELRSAFADKILTRHKMTRDEALWEALAYMRFLHSQGVVIKVDKELPETTVYVRDLCDSGLADVVKRTRSDMLKAGCVATEPLIEVCEHDWIKLRNKVITSGEICTKCKSLRSEADGRIIPMIEEAK